MEGLQIGLPPVLVYGTKLQQEKCKECVRARGCWWDRAAEVCIAAVQLPKTRERAPYNALFHPNAPNTQKIPQQLQVWKGVIHVQEHLERC